MLYQGKRVQSVGAMTFSNTAKGWRELLAFTAPEGRECVVRQIGVDYHNGIAKYSKLRLMVDGNPEWAATNVPVGTLQHPSEVYVVVPPGKRVALELNADSCVSGTDYSFAAWAILDYLIAPPGEAAKPTIEYPDVDRLIPR